MAERKIRDYAKIHAEKFKENFDSNNTRNYQDERFWVLTRDETGNGNAVIRFLPNKNENDLPFKPTFKHTIKINGKYFIDKCPTTIGKDCPICDWNKGQDKDFILKNGTYRKKSWICNILVISDPKNRENEGKVFLFEFGKQIYNILKETVQPEEDTETPLYYYCPDNGANFKLRVRKEGQFGGSWLKSSFMKPSPIDDDLTNLNITDDDWLNSLYNLDEVITGNTYKEYTELKTKFNKYLSNIDMDGLSQTNEIDKVEKEGSESYSRLKASAENKIKETVKETNNENEEDKPKNTEKKPSIQNNATKAKVKNYFEEVNDDD